MSLLNTYKRMGRRERCPVCDHADWCLVRRDVAGSVIAVICPRTPSPTVMGDAGYLHELQPGARPRTRRRRVLTSEPGRDFTRTLAWLRGTSSRGLEDLVRELGLPVAALAGVGFVPVDRRALRCLGFAWAHRAWAVPMFTAAGVPCGIRLRFPGGQKLAVAGSKNGLFIAGVPLGSKALVIAEGESDTAALAACGVPAVGRPGARSVVDEVLAYVRARPVTRVVVLGDADEVGQSGALDLARRIERIGRPATVVTPPAKDLRAWIAEGAMEHEVRALVGLAVNAEVTRG